MLRLLLPILLASLVSANQVLTLENFDELTKDKAVFIRFVTEWCEECKETQEAWASLEDDWKDHPIAFVREVSCDTDTDDEEEQALICESFEVSGYPSVYWGDPSSPEVYLGKLDYESLSQFAEENLKTLPCSLKNLDACDAKTKKMIAKLREKPLEELEALEKDVIHKVEEEQSRFDRAALKLQEQYKEIATNFNTKVDKLRDDSGFKWIQQVLNEIYEDNEQSLTGDEL